MDISKKEFSYHPFRAYFKLYNQIIEAFDRADLDNNPKMVYNQKLSYHFKEIIKPIINNSDIPYAPPFGELEYADEVFDFLSSYDNAGENLFHIRNELTEMLKLTDVSEVKVSDIKLLYDTFYIHYGNNGVKLFDGYQLIGTYVDQFDLSDDETNIIGFLHVASKQPYLYPPNSSEKIVFEKEIYYFETLEYWPLEKNTIQENYEFSLESTKNGKLSPLENKWQPYQLEVYKLVINSLLYLSSVPEDINSDFSKNTPQKIVTKIKRSEKNGNKKVAKRTESKAQSSGYRKVKFVGNNVRNKLKLNKGNKSISAHWRRGHWRRQPFGKNNSKTKLLWIAPTLVSTDDKSEVEIKHLYDVENKNA